MVDNSSEPTSPTRQWDSELTDWESEGGAPAPPNKVRCDVCGYRPGVSCTCGMTFAEKIKSVGIDAQALRIFHGN